MDPARRRHRAAVAVENVMEAVGVGRWYEEDKRV
jgi:hypothetical protein